MYNFRIELNNAKLSIEITHVLVQNENHTKRTQKPKKVRVLFF
jgi:hypothetical protein